MLSTTHIAGELLAAAGRPFHALVRATIVFWREGEEVSLAVLASTH